MIFDAILFNAILFYNSITYRKDEGIISEFFFFVFLFLNDCQVVTCLLQKDAFNNTRFESRMRFFFDVFL